MEVKSFMPLSLTHPEKKITKKKYHCCIPGCNTYDTVNNFVQIPSDTDWRQQWLSVIPRKNWIVDHSTLACSRHFLNDNIVSTDSSSSDSSKDDSISSLTIPTLNGSVPLLMPPQEKCYATDYVPVSMFQLYPRDSPGPEVFEDIENTENTDYIVDYCFLQLTFAKRFSSMISNNWKVCVTKNRIIFYIVDFSEMPRIAASIKIDVTLKVTVTLAGRIMDPADLTWILPITSKLNRWSQLNVLLTIFGKNN